MKELLQGNKIILVIGSFAVLMAMILIGIQFAGSQAVIVEPSEDVVADDSAHNGDFKLFETKTEAPETLEGTVTEVFTDCSEKKVLNDAGEVVVSDDPITCDGGSYVKIDDTTIYTSSGLTTPEFAFNKHKAALDPGTDVTIIALPTTVDKTYTLNCDECSLTASATPPSNEVQVITGAVEEVFTDCVERKTLGETGEVITSTDGISCDGGSYIIVDDTRINTASGFVPAELSFSKHQANLDPGTQVVVRAVATEFDSKTLTLFCDDCSLEALKLLTE